MKQILLLVETSRGYGRGIMKGIAQYAREVGQWSIQFEDRGLLETPPDWLARWKGDGVISRCALPAMDRLLNRLKIPRVELLDRGVREVAEVHSDDIALGKIAADFFFHKGFTQFAFFSFGESWWSRLRRDSWIATLAQYGLTSHCFHDSSTPDTASHQHWKKGRERLLIKWLRELPKPIALWASTDEEASRVHALCRQANIRIPDDISLLGTSNDTLVCSLPYPNISSIDTNSFRVGYLAAELLDHRMNHRPEPETPIAVTPIGIVTRGSTDLVPLDNEEVSQAMQMIRDETEKGINVNEIAQRLGISRRTLERNFFRLTGTTPKQEILRTRIEIAKQLLRETGLTLTAVSWRAGFGSLRYFIAAFRKNTGMTPGVYRTSMKMAEKEEVLITPAEGGQFDDIR